jgi:ABC-type lipoprotein release transport system permease subunit
MNNGLQSKLEEGINQAISGQLTIYSATDSKINILESQLKEQHPFILPDELLREITEKENLTVNKRIRFGALVSCLEETSYINIHALENNHIERIHNLLSLKKGQMPLNEKDILISETTADELKCNVGDTILLLANNINDYMSDDIAIISGIFEEKGIAIFLNYNAFIPYAFGEELVQLEDGSYLELIVNPAGNKHISKEAMEQIERKIAKISPEIHVASWEQTVPLFYKIVQVWKGSGYFTQAIFIVFSLLILVNLTTLIINSRKKEFGTLLAFGFTWMQMSLMLIVEYLVITVVSVLIGYGLIELQIGLIAENGIYIPSKDMQSALMTEYLKPIIYIKDVIYTLLLFCLTTSPAVLISISRIRKQSPIVLINKK